MKATYRSGMWERLLNNGSFFHWTRIPAYWGTIERVALALDLLEGESLLDVGCGTGVFARLATGSYVGFDTGLRNLRYARDRTSHPRHAFVAMSAADLGLAAQSVDKAIVINMVHHLDRLAIERLLGQLHRVVRDRVLLVDAAPDIANPVERFFMRHDRGAHIRERDELRSMIGGHYKVECEDVFHNTLHTAPQVLFRLAPKAELG